MCKRNRINVTHKVDCEYKKSHITMKNQKTQIFPQRNLAPEIKGTELLFSLIVRTVSASSRPWYNIGSVKKWNLLNLVLTFLQYGI